MERTDQPTIIQVLKAAAVYFAFVFGADFVFGTIRHILDTLTPCRTCSTRSRRCKTIYLPCEVASRKVDR